MLVGAFEFFSTCLGSGDLLFSDIEFPKKLTLSIVFELDFIWLLVMFFSRIRILTPSLLLLNCSLIVPYTNTLFWKITTPVTTLSVLSMHFWKIDEEFFNPWGSRHVLNNPWDVLIVHIFLVSPSSSIWTRASERSKLPSMRSHVGCGRLSPCLVMGSSYPWPCYWYALSSLSSTLFLLCLTTRDALVTPPDCAVSRTPCLATCLSSSVTLFWRGRGIFLALQNNGCDACISFTWAF